MRRSLLYAVIGLLLVGHVGVLIASLGLETKGTPAYYRAWGEAAGFVLGIPIGAVVGEWLIKPRVRASSGRRLVVLAVALLATLCLALVVFNRRDGSGFERGHGAVASFVEGCERECAQQVPEDLPSCGGYCDCMAEELFAGRRRRESLKLLERMKEPSADMMAEIERLAGQCQGHRGEPVAPRAPGAATPTVRWLEPAAAPATATEAERPSPGRGEHECTVQVSIRSDRGVEATATGSELDEADRVAWAAACEKLREAGADCEDRSVVERTKRTSANTAIEWGKGTSGSHEVSYTLYTRARTTGTAWSSKDRADACKRAREVACWSLLDAPCPESRVKLEQIDGVAVGPTAQ